MGNSGSNSNSNSASTSKAKRNHKHKHKHKDLVSADDARALLNLVQQAEKSTKDESSKNLLCNFAKLLQEPRLGTFEMLVAQSKTTWDEILRLLDRHGKQFEEPDVKDVRRAHTEYWDLLLKTRRIFEIVVKESQIQQRNVRRLLKMINKYDTAPAYQSKPTLTNRDQITYSESMKNMAQWLKVAGLSDLAKEWGNMATRLRKMGHKWDDHVKALGQDAFKRLSFLEKFRTIADSGWKIALAVTVTVATVGIVPIIISCQLDRRSKLANEEMVRAYTAASQITARIRVLLVASLKMQMQIEASQSTAEKIALEIDSNLKTASLATMQESIVAIGKHLTEYIAQGQAVISAVKRATNDYITSVSA